MLVGIIDLLYDRIPSRRRDPYGLYLNDIGRDAARGESARDVGSWHVTAEINVGCHGSYRGLSGHARVSAERRLLTRIGQRPDQIGLRL